MSNLVNITTSSRKRMSISLSAGNGARSHAAEADRLSTPRRIILAGAVEGEGLFDGSDDVVIYATGEMYELMQRLESLDPEELLSDEDALTYDEIDEIIDSIDERFEQ